MSPRSVVICGATGFIGRNMAEALANDRSNFAVTGIYNLRPPFEYPGIEWVQADLTDKKQAERAVDGADIVIQAAATTSGAKDIVTRPYIHVADNAVMNSHLLRAAWERKVSHFIFFSCSVMYQSLDRPIGEDDFDPSAPIEPKYFGAAYTKLYIERMCEFYSRISDTRFTIIRHSNVYGPHDKFDLERSHVFGATVTKVLTAADGRISVWGDGTERRDLLYVADLIEFVRLAIERQKMGFRLYNVGVGDAVSVQDLVEAIVAASGRNIRIDYDLTKPTIPTSLCLDSSLARAELEWVPKVTLAEGIRRTLDWYRIEYATADVSNASVAP